MNPFDLNDLRTESAWYPITKYDDNAGVRIDTRMVTGQCNELLNVAMFIPADNLYAPVLRIDKQIWMSLTPMEIQAAWVPLQLAHGEVATGGLGLGYFALRAAEKDDVVTLDVYERDQRVIDLFHKLHSKCAGFEKINIIHGDIRETMVDKYYDFVFMDIYPCLLDAEIFNRSTITRKAFVPPA